MLSWIRNLRYLFGERCNSEFCGYHCIYRESHSGYHTEDYNLRWGNEYRTNEYFLKN